MKHCTLVVSLLVLGVLLAMPSFAGVPQKGRVPEELRNYVDDATLSLWQSRMSPAALKNLADDDLPRPQTVTWKKWLDGSIRDMSASSIRLAAPSSAQTGNAPAKRVAKIA